MKKQIEVEHFNFSYGTRNVLSNINFSVNEGEIVGVLGINGSGKTTLLNSIYGLNNKTNSILVSNKPVDANTRKNISFIEDNPILVDYLNGKEYLEFVKQLNKDRIISDYQPFIDTFNLDNDLENKVIKEYSHGMRKKIQITSELILNKKIFLIDEPTNGLDIEAILDFRNIIKNLSLDDKVTFIIASHDISFLEKVCDRVLILGHTKILKVISNVQPNTLEDIFVSTIEREL